MLMASSTSLASTLRNGIQLHQTLELLPSLLYFPLDANDHPEMDTSDDSDIDEVKI
jgi:hypothetical protein